MKKDLACNYCANIELLNIVFSDCEESFETGLAARGHFLKRIKNLHYPAWPVKLIVRQKEGHHSKLVIGRDHFGLTWQEFNVEILGLSLDKRPEMPPIPFFGISTTGPLVKAEGTDYWVRDKERTKYVLWNACRITHERFSFIIKLHWWPDHGRVFMVERLDFDDVKAFAALKTGLSMFSRGRGRKPNQNYTSNKHFLSALNEAIIRRHEAGFGNKEIREVEIAEDLFPESNHGARELRRWLQTSWRRFRWPDVVKAIIENEMEERYMMIDDFKVKRT